MRVLCVFGRHNYGDPTRGESYEYANFIPTLKRLGHEVSFFDSWSKSAYTDFAALNRRLLETVESLEPDVILVVLLNYEIWLETLGIIRKNCRASLINWAPDDSWKYEQSSRYVAPYFDVHATTYPDALGKAVRDGLSNFVLTQWAANGESLSEPLPAERCRYSVSFVGTAYGNRKKWISNLRRRGISVDCFGHGWERGPVAAEEIPGIIRESVISLNFAHSGIVLKGFLPRRSRQVKARTFEVPGEGGFLMTESAENLDSFFIPGREIVTFDRLGELEDKIKFYLAHPSERDAIAWRGFARTRNEHTYDVRFRRLLTVAVERLSMRSRGERLEKPCRFDFNAFGELARRYQPGPGLGFVRWLLLLCTAFLGRERGPKAARRLLYELSWRLAGSKTFTATGWPGRLFYREI